MQSVASEHLRIAAFFVACFLLAALGVYALVGKAVAGEVEAQMMAQGPQALANMISAARQALP